MNGKKQLVIILLLVLVSPLFAEGASKTGNTVELLAGTPVQSELSLHSGMATPSRTFSFRVSRNTFAVKLTLNCDTADLDLFVYKASKAGDLSHTDYSAETEQYSESVFASRLSETPLESGIYYVTVAYQYDYLPQSGGQNMDTITYSLKLDEITAKPSAALVPGTAQTLTLTPGDGMFTVASVDIPDGTASFRVDVYNTNADVDIFAATDAPAKTRSESLYAAEGLIGTESLVISGSSDSELTAGRYYLSFVDQVANEYRQDFSVMVTLGSEPPAALLNLPVLAIPSDSFDTALMSTVEVISANGKGSGCLVSASGHLITNWHVIAGPDDNPSKKIFVAVSTANDEPPKELFAATVLDYDKDLDMALLIVDKGRYGQSLPESYRFPYLNIGDPSTLKIGQPLGVIGYPDVGGTGSRTTITFTSGVVSGFEKAEHFTYIKTDALINSGNSGGAVINAYYELLGFPGYIMDVKSGRMGYIYPVSCLPAKWTQIINDGNK